jgi:hypothetical protein
MGSVPVPRTRDSSPQWNTVKVLDQPKVVDCLRAISNLRKLGENWDGYGSPRIGNSALSAAEDIVLQAPLEDVSAPHICPVSGGSVGFHWRAGNRELELTVHDNGTIEYLAIPDRDTEDESSIEEGVLSRGCAGDVVRWLHWLVEV